MEELGKGGCGTVYSGIALSREDEAAFLGLPEKSENHQEKNLEEESQSRQTGESGKLPKLAKMTPASKKTTFQSWIPRGTLIAVKVMVPKTTKEFDGLAQEVSHLETLGADEQGFRHKNVVQMLAYEMDREKLFVLIALELADRGDLKSFALEHQLNLPLLRDCFRDCVEGVGFMQSRKILHMDLKPHNFLVFTDESTYDSDEASYVVKVSDFGLARRLGTHARSGLSLMEFNR